MDRASPRWRRLPAAAAVAVAAGTSALTILLGVDVPHVDDWALVPVVAAFHEPDPPFVVLFDDHMGHVSVVPRLAILGLGFATGWDLRAQMLLTQATFLGAFLALVALWRRTARPSAWALPAIAAFLFSLHGWMNHLWACQIHVGLAVLGVTGSIALLALGDLTHRRLIAAGLAALAASWSFLSGFAVWPAALLLILARPRRPRGVARPVAALAWIAMAACATALPLAVRAYFGQHRVIASPVDPAQAFPFLVRYLGAGLVGPGASGGALDAAGGLGLAALLVLPVATARLLRRSPADLGAAALGVFALGTAIMTALGRSALGVETAAASRYTTISGLGWIAVVLMADALRRRGGVMPRRIAGAALAGFLAVLLATQPASLAAAVEFARGQREARAAFRAGRGISLGVVQSAMGGIGPAIHHLGLKVAMLRDHRLSLFRDAPPPPAAQGGHGLTARILDGSGGGRVAIEVAGGVPGNLVVASASRERARLAQAIASFDDGGRARIELAWAEGAGRVGIAAYALDAQARIVGAPPLLWPP